jgi:DNA 3'-phosphatase
MATTEMEKLGLYMYIPTTIPAKPKSLYMFDVDGTILTSVDGSVVSDEDFEFLGPIPEVFERLEKAGAVIALVSNQMYWKDKQKEKFQRLRILFPTVIQAVATGGSSPFRKPNAAIFNEIVDVIGGKPRSIHYIGDAIGPTATYPPYKWSDSDKAFAEAIGATFHEPIEFFPHVRMPLPDLGEQELVLLVGPPGSGKSTVSASMATEANHVVVNQDLLETKAKVIKAGAAAWAAGKSVIVDATHPTRAKRQEIIEGITGLAQTPVRVLWFIRDGRPFNKERPEPVPESAYRIYTKNF